MSNTQEDMIKASLSRNDFALIGAGQLGDMALSLWPPILPLPTVVLDSKKVGLCHGVNIAKLQGYRADPKPVYLLSAFKLSAQEVKEIFANLGQDIVLTVYDFFEQYCPSIFSNGWRSLEPDASKLSLIASVRECFSDKRSLAVFDAAIDWRYRRVLTPTFECEPESTKYDLRRYAVELGDYDSVFDVGAYDLSLASYLNVASIRVQRYVAFEADDTNFQRCLDSLSYLAPLGPETVILEKRALFEDDSERVFLESGLLSSRLVEVESQEVPGKLKSLKTISLDSYLDELDMRKKGRVLLKLHIEGAELPVLKGAETFIRKTKPDIFVNLSHDEISLLDIPLFLRGLGGYHMSLAGHSLFGEGITLFATQFSGHNVDAKC
jgi:FkbM family methyltransferase